jgi:Type ISP C-terminal specificity domain/N-6 DNA Methylase
MERAEMTENETILHDYLKEIERYYKLGIAKEHSYRSTLQTMLPKLVPAITAVNEPKRVACGAPDYAVLRSTGGTSLTIGYIEAKDIGVPLDKIEKDEQLKRYLHALDSLILTDYLEFRWYVKGDKQMAARLATPHGGKSLTPDKKGIVATGDLLCSFLHHSAEPIRKPEELAKRMARLTHMIRDITIQAFEKRDASDTLNGLYEAFKTVLLPQLPTTEFADMFAQTLAYGLFAARYNHHGKEPFNRSDAAKEIPRTNPFLRKLFNTIAGTDFDDEPFIGFVNELTQVLGVTDMDAVLADFGKRTRREDPIVHFYETFLTQYDPKLRELRGVYYTPEPVVSYIVRSVDYLLREHFDCPDGLADTSTITYTYVDEQGERRTERSPRVLLLDPACGTGTFSYTIIDHIRETYRKTGNAGMWSSYVREHLLPRLFGFELLMAPYAVAHLKLGMQLAALDLPKEERSNWAYDFESDERLGVYLTNTLEQAFSRSKLLLGSFISDEANEAARVKQDYPVMVVLGNPPYSGHSANKGEWVTDLLHGDDGRSGKKVGNYFEVDGKPLGERNSKWLNDDYVKFIRFAQWRIEQTGYGILAFITNHGYLDNPTFRGMRQSLMQSFDDIYVLDLHGNSKKKERSPDGSKDENVFDIQQGVAIGIFVKRKQRSDAPYLANVHHAHLWGPREVYEKTFQGQHLVGGKYYWLAENDMTTTEWKVLAPQAPLYLFIFQEIDLRSEYELGWKIPEIFPKTLLGPNSHRDDFAIAFTYDEAYIRIRDFANLALLDEELRQRYSLEDNRDWSLQKARKQKFDGVLPVNCIYRPFDFRFMLYGSYAFDYPRPEINDHMLQYNLALISTRQTKEKISLLVTNKPAGQHKLATPYDGSYLSPLYTYPDTKKESLLEVDDYPNAPGGRHPNLSPAFITAISSKLKMQYSPDGKGDLHQTSGPEDIFDYMYAVFHSPTYRTRYGEFLKIDFPRLPLTSNADLFRELCRLGERLVGLHLMEKFGKAVPKYPAKGNNMVEKIEYLEPRDQPELGRVYINKEQYFEGVQLEVWNFHVGGYQVCQKWLKDRKGRVLSFGDIQHYQRVVAALGETIELMGQVDVAIEERGGWPIE